MTRFWTLPLCAALVAVAACSKPAAEPPPGGDPLTPPSQGTAGGAVPVEDAAQTPPLVTPPPAPVPAPVSPPTPVAKPPAPAPRPPVQNVAPPAPVVRAPEPPKPTHREVTVSSGTEIPVELLTALTSATAAVETEVRARLRQAITVNGDTVIPNGSTLIGSVTEVERAGRVQGRARLALRFTEVSFSGETHRISTGPLLFEAESTKKDDAVKVGAGAGIGAVIGGILGGGKGAATGAAIGGAAGGGTVLATRGKEVELASGTTLTPVLSSPLTMSVEIR